MTKADAIEPIVALEATVVAGRTLQAYKRGKGDEARERFLEESTGSIVWLLGVQVLNEVGDKILGKVLKHKGANFDVGTDKVLRTPFDNFMKNVAPRNLSSNQVALLKGAKVLTSIALANMFIGCVVPKLNHTLTNIVRHNKRIEEEQSQKNNDDVLDLSTNKSSEDTKNTSPSFKGGVSALNVFTNAIENTNTGKLLSTDVGIAGGRMYNARTKEERREIAIRDIGSIYFYMWAQGHVGNILSFIETGKFTRLNPSSAKILDEHLCNFIKNNGGEMSVDNFKDAVLGKKSSEINLPEGIHFDSGELSIYDKFMNKFKKTKEEPLKVAKLKDVENIIQDNETLSRIREMSKLQPTRLGESVITKQQIIDSINKSEINDPKLLDKIYTEFTKGANKEEYKFVSNKTFTQLKKEMIEYVERICKASKNGKVDESLIKKINNKNIVYSGINLAAGFVVAATFLSTLIPKFQYYITKKTTGVDAFPGTYDYEKHQEVIV
jgi:hypothetical protein